MVENKGKISIAFFSEDFKGNPTLLLWGEPHILGTLADFVADAGRSDFKSRYLTELDWTRVQPGLRIWVEHVTEDAGISRSTDNQENEFTWRITTDVAKIFVNLIKELAAADHPGHQYLEAGTHEDVVVMVSKGEYDDLDPKKIDR